MRAGVIIRNGRIHPNPVDLADARLFVGELRAAADTAENQAGAATKSKAGRLRQNARAARRDAMRFEREIENLMLIVG